MNIQDLINWFFGAKKQPTNIIEDKAKHMYITYESYITASGKYPERLKSLELTPELIDNANKLVDVINSFLFELGDIKEIVVSSGFRPSDVNNNTPGAAKKSNHTKCLAVDIADANGSIDKIMMDNLELLKKHGLYLEDPQFTKNWSHVQITAPKSGKRVFIP